MHAACPVTGENLPDRRAAAYASRVLRAPLIGLAALAAACSRPSEDNPVPHAPAPAPTTELTIEERWSGAIAVDERAEPDPIAVLVIRDDAAYDELVARLPATRIQKRQPAPPSDDPLLARPPIDFTTDMLVVVVRAFTLDRPAILRVAHDGTRVVVTHDAASTPPGARPFGIGGYAAARVPRRDGAAVLATPRVIEDAAGLAGAAGTVVTLRGELSRTKIPTLLGVDVDPGHATPGDPAEATGWLETIEVTQAEIDARIAESGQFAHRGPGTFRRLLSADRQTLATARPLHR